ncbi:MAG: hypothetical protein ACRDRA_19950 [Pseudonocardiaceae bacterium]
MNDFDHNAPSNLPAVVTPGSVMRTQRRDQRRTQWRSGSLPARLRRASQHPAVASSLATIAGLVVQAGLRRALTPGSRSASRAGSAISPTASAPTSGGTVVLISRTIVIRTWTKHDRRI